ncbi:adenine phosphoribosyltransferase [Polymorphobacter fuscus]|uniref:Adenine phosphoribosyltransferase n=1 Tax=Sandarakinorhabdus fusca TaxID=1439888 RepID=A0A7C9GZC1_9SPHN|nr:adenine phosphoribosyltransferase [Polymorphobacter fuscus]KAB7644109.1 adenine phosphoribosyltransferase [Polymorphobacter fuscus]MQT18494.1 adenine phosphoribosyltransferase [Polymorphobacter fuscus]NJC08385.1 adenine phosphoribosyltransferase [Polymorphobacter fuscus]
MANEDLYALVRTIADYPKPGIQFRDITTLLLDGRGFGLAIERMAAAVGPAPDLVAGVEARGFIFGAALAHRLGCGMVLLRKSNKLPGRVTGINYALEYGQDRLEMHSDAVTPEQRVLLVDDLIATGGTALAGVDLLRGAGAVVSGASFVIDLPDLGGAERLRRAGVAVSALLEYAGD